MSYPIINLEVADPLLQLPPGALEEGCALVIRRRGKPVGFLLPENIIGTTGDDTLPRLISEYAADRNSPDAKCEAPTTHPPVKDPPVVTAVICTRDRPVCLARCLESLRSVAIPEGYPLTHFSILVVDNAPSDNKTELVVGEYPEVRYVCEKKPGLDFARNRGWNEATGGIIAYLDDDVVADRGWLQGLIEAYQACPAAAAFTGLVLPYQLETEAQLLFEKRGGFRKGFDRIVFGQEMLSDPLYPVGAMKFGVGANMAFVRQILERIGGFDEALDCGPPLPGGGDLDMFYRIIRAGYSLVYEPSYLVFHEHRRDNSTLRRQYFSWGLSVMAFVTKSYRTDPTERKKLLKLIFWWTRYQALLLLRGLGGSKEFRPDFVLAELLGGGLGLCGEYKRSIRRIQKIRQEF